MSQGALPARLGHLVVTSAVVVFAVWTLVYQVALLADLPAVASLVVALVLGVAVVVLVERRESERGGVVVPLPALVPSLAVVAATVVATGLGLAGLRGVALAIAGVGAAVALVVAARAAWSRRPHEPAGASRHPSRDPRDDNGDANRGHVSDTSHVADEVDVDRVVDEVDVDRVVDEVDVDRVVDEVDVDRVGGTGVAETSGWLWPVGWVLALLSGALASVIARPDGDDAYFVNLSTWVAERGRFPLNDTMISPDVFPANSAHSPPVHSIEGLIGALARLLDIEAGTATYVLVPPLATILGVLVLTRVVEEARIPAAPVALTAVVGYLWTAGSSGYSLGTFFGVRIWQGKAMLVAIVLPLVLLLGMALVRRGTLRNHLLFGATLVAGVGTSNTAVFLVPVMVAGLVLAAISLRKTRGALRLVLWVAYPLAAGLLTFMMAPESPTLAQLTAEGLATASGGAGDPLMTVPGSRTLFVVSALASGIGLLGIQELMLRTAALGTIVSAGVALLPPGRSLLEAIGLASVTWRMWWVIPIPMLVAGLVGAVAGRVPRPATPLLVAVPVAATVALVPLVGGQWVGSPGAGARIVSPLTWKVPRDALKEARFVERISRPGDTVLVPWETARVLAALTVDVQPVSARRSYLRGYASTPEARAGSREELQEFIDSRTPSTNTIDDDLDALSVDTACVGSTRGRAVDLLEANGFQNAGRVGNLVCLRR